MSNILKELYFGEIPPFWEHSPEDEEYRRKMRESVKADRELRAAFPEAEALIDKHDNARNEMEDVILYNQFVFGFRVGAQLMLEMMKKVD